MESRESISVDSRTQHTAYVRRSEGMVVVRLRDHFTATRAYYISTLCDLQSLPKDPLLVSLSVFAILCNLLQRLIPSLDHPPFRFVKSPPVLVVHLWLGHSSSVSSLTSEVKQAGIVVHPHQIFIPLFVQEQRKGFQTWGHKVIKQCHT
jgi:hypothetical protein